MAKSSEAVDAPQAGRSRKPLLIVVAAVLVLLAGGGAAAAYFLGLLGAKESHAEAPAASAHGAAADHPPVERTPPSVVFVDVPDVVVNLQATGARMRFLKLRLSLEVPDDAAAQSVRTLMPRILDSFQLYLRALTVEDLAGSGGMQRLKEDLVARSNLAVDPVRINDVLLKEMLVQ